MTKLTQNDFKFFSYFTLLWLTLAWLGFVLTLLGFFRWQFLALFFGIFATFGLRFLLKSAFRISRFFLLINIFVIFVIIIFSIFTNPTVFSGRDQASLSQAAIRLSQFGQPEFSTPVSKSFYNINDSFSQDKFNQCLSDKKIPTEWSFSDLNLKQKISLKYCQAISSGKALNFPGFYYTTDGNLVTNFPLVYISWLAIFYTFFGIGGFILANAITFYIFIISFLFILNQLASRAPKKKAPPTEIIPIGLILLLSSFPFMWFFKFTLSENIALSLLWFGILQLIHLTKNKSFGVSFNFSFFAFLLSFGLLVFARIEGILFFIAMLPVVFFSKRLREQIFKKRLLFFSLFLLIIAILFVWNFFVDIYFYKTIAKALLDGFSDEKITIKNTSFFNLLAILAIYGLLLPLVLGIAQIFIFLKNRNYNKLIPFFITLPVFIYIFSPQITPTHPWMLRRFVFAVLPVAILYSVLLIDKIGRRKKLLAGLVFLMILATNLPSFTKYLSFRPGENLLTFTRQTSELFSKNDLVLIDRQVTGDNWQMISDPMNSLFKKNSVYFFNPQDLKQLDLENYDKVFLISPNQKVSYYQKTIGDDKLKFVKNYSLTLPILERSDLQKISLPETKNLIVNGQIFEIKK